MMQMMGAGGGENDGDNVDDADDVDDVCEMQMMDVGGDDDVDKKTVEVSSSSLKKQHLGRAFGNNVDVRLATPLQVGGIKNNGQINIPSLDPWSLIASWMWETVNINYYAVN